MNTTPSSDDTIMVEGFALVRISAACPEQFEVYDDGAKVAYVRIRHGRLAVHLGDFGGPVVHEATANGDGALDDEERDRELHAVVAAIKAHLGRA
jgi:hypothetical protein